MLGRPEKSTQYRIFRDGEQIATARLLSEGCLEAQKLRAARIESGDGRYAWQCIVGVWTVVEQKEPWED